jgi:Zn-dependent M32 family carboxypeptidase
MSFTPHDPRDIPVLTEAIDSSRTKTTALDYEAAQSAIVAEALRIADELLHQAAKDMEAILFERVYDRLREQLPEIVDKVLKEQIGRVKTQDP